MSKRGRLRAIRDLVEGPYIRTSIPIYQHAKEFLDEQPIGQEELGRAIGGPRGVMTFEII